MAAYLATVENTKLNSQNAFFLLLASTQVFNVFKFVLLKSMKVVFPKTPILIYF